MKKIYCISGLGSDEKIFAKIKVESYELAHIPWLPPQKNEPIESYAKRMSDSIPEADPIVMGLSFGGMLGIEIAKLRPVKKLILVSSVKSSKELPRWMRISGRLYLNKLVRLRPYKILEPIENYNMGISNKEEIEMVRQYRRNVNTLYLSWSIDTILNWKNDKHPPNVFHIHGDKDRIFPLSRIKPDHIIRDGGHMMIYNHSFQINAALKIALNA